MTGRDFRNGLDRVLRSLGFGRAGRVFARAGEGVWTLVATEKGFGSQWFINVGFWLESLGGSRPDRVEASHLYFRLERVVPGHHETIAMAGALDEPGQANAHDSLLRLLVDVIDPELRKLGTEGGLRDAMKAGRLSHGLVLEGARSYLSDRGGAEQE